jgi:hypothetical protein
MSASVTMMSVSMNLVLADVTGSISLKNSELVTALLILVLGIAMGIGLTCLLMVVHFLRKGRLVARNASRRGEWSGRERRYHGPLFQCPARWLAVRSGNPLLVQAALGLHNPTPCSWEEGLSAAHDRRLFISPPIRGWVLIMGTNLPEPNEDVDKCYRFVLELSRKLGQVQFFSVNRAVNHHAWVQADQGAIVRAYAWAGRTVWNQGNATRAEMELGLRCFTYGEGEERIDFGRPDPAALNTERLTLLAARWSVDPTAIDPRMLRENQGIAGQLSRSRTH